jgi:hypothetical protein
LFGSPVENQSVIKALRILMKVTIENLPIDNRSGTLMSNIFAIYKSKKLHLDPAMESKFDETVTLKLAWEHVELF